MDGPESHFDVDSLLEHARFVRALAHSLVGSDHADDVVQETWAAAIEHPPERGRDLRPWLRVVARNVARTFRRSAARRKEREREHAARQPRDHVEAVASLAQRRAVMRRVVEEIEALKEPYRSVVLLRHYEALTPREVGRRLGAPVETVRTWNRRALEQLRARLDAGDQDGNSWVLALAPLVEVAPAPMAPGGPTAVMGGFIMKLGMKVGLGLVGLLLGAVLLDPGSGPSEEVFESKEASEPGQQPVVGENARPPTREVAAESRAPEPALDGAASCRILGRVVTERGEPIEGIGVEVEQEQVMTDADGRYAIDLPVSAGGLGLGVGLLARGPEHLTLGALRLGFMGTTNPIVLVEGDCKVPDIMLVQAGSVAGTVRDSQGRPVEGAEVWVVEPNLYRGPRASTDATGEYVLGHLPVGLCGLRASSDGFLFSEGHPVQIQVEAGRRREGYAFTLQESPVIGGKVVDENGDPMIAVDIWASPVGGEPGTPYAGAGAETDADGRFRVLLRHDLPHRLSFRLVALEYETSDGVSARSFNPGTGDALIVLKRLPTMTFRIRPPRGGEPIEQARLETYKGDQYTGDGFPFMHPAPGGLIKLTIPPSHGRYVVRAPGYPPREGKIVPDDPDGQVMTIGLREGATIRGRALVNRKPAAAIMSTLRWDWFPRDPELPFPGPVYSNNRRRDLSDFTGRVRYAETGADGVFVIGELAEGTYRLDLSAPDRRVGTLQRWRIRVERGQVIDLGDLAMPANASVEGQVVIGDGESTTGFVVSLDDSRVDDNDSVVGVDGRFRFDGLGPGSHMLYVISSNRMVANGDPYPFEAIPGEITQMDLDLRPRRLCRLRFIVTANGEPMAGAYLRSFGERSGEDGLIDELVMPNCGVELRSATGVVLRSLGPDEVPAGGWVDQHIDLVVGTAVLVFPAGFDPVDDETAVVGLRDLTRETFEYGVDFTRPGVEYEQVRWEQRDIDLGMVPVGRYRVRVTTRSDERASMGQPRTTTFTGRMDVERGARSVCTLRRH